MANIIGTANPDILTGTALPDTVQGLASDDVIYGFDGNDLLQGGTGDDILYGGSGDDLMDGGAGEDLFFGQSGRDTVSYTSSLSALTLSLADPSLSTGDAAGDWFLSVETFLLTAFGDTFIGSGFADEAQGGAGDDHLRGMAGNDSLLGGAGNDTLEGGTGADALVGGSGTDMASYANAATSVNIDLRENSSTFGGEANGDIFTSIEAVQGSSFHDRLVLAGGVTAAQGGSGNDSLTGGAAAETLDGQSGDDSLVGGGGADVLSGGEGSDRLFGGVGADTMDGGTDGLGVDSVIYTSKVTLNLLSTANGTGEAKGDVLSGIEALRFGGAGSTYVGGAQAISVVLTGSSLTCQAGAGAEDFSVEGIGSLAVSYLGTTSAVTLTYLGGGIPSGGTVLQGGGGASGDMLQDVSNLTLTNLADTLIMDAGLGLYDGSPPITLRAGAGADLLGLAIGSAALVDGGSGNDTIEGFLVQGLVTGGLGHDVIDLVRTGLDIGDVTLSGGDGNDQIASSGHNQAQIEGGAGNDLISAGGETTSAVVSGGIGDDTVTASGVSVILDGGDGNDVLDGDVAFGVAGFASLTGGAGADDLTLQFLGVSANCLVDGGADNDTLVVSAFSGSALGGDGDDDIEFVLFISGSGGLDVQAGAGNDTILLSMQFAGSANPGSSGFVAGGAGDDTITDQTLSAFMLDGRFVFATGWGDDDLTGFDNGTDRLQFSGTSGAGLDSFDDLTVTGDATHTLVSFGTDSIDLIGFDIALFDATDVLFA